MDEDRIRRAQAGDPESFADLVRTYQGPVYSLAWRLAGNAEDARDLAQEAFLKIYLALPKYRFDAPLRTWLLRIVTNHCLDWLRRRPPPSVPLDAAGAATAPAATDSEVESRLAAEALRQAVRELPPHYQVIVILHYTQDLSYREIADVLRIPVRTVETRLARARALLRRRLGAIRDPCVESPAVPPAPAVRAEPARRPGSAGGAEVRAQ